jgi:hypothetical protein
MADSVALVAGKVARNFRRRSLANFVSLRVGTFCFAVKKTCGERNPFVREALRNVKPRSEIGMGVRQIL